jgi:UDP-glucose 4-epimerase
VCGPPRHAGVAPLPGPSWSKAGPLPECVEHLALHSQVRRDIAAGCAERRRVGDPPVLVARARKALEVLDWAPKYTKLDETVDTAWQSGRRC